MVQRTALSKGFVGGGRRCRKLKQSRPDMKAREFSWFRKEFCGFAWIASGVSGAA